MKTSFFNLITIGVLVLFSACNKKDKTAPNSSIRLMNASPTAATMYLAPDGIKSGADVNYGSVSEYNKVNAGGFNVRINLGTSTLPFTNSDVVLDADKFYTIIITDSINKFKKSLITDSQTDPPSGRAFIRFFHLVGNGPTVDLYKSGSPIFSNRSFNDQSIGAGVNYISVDPGTQTFELRSAGGGSILALLSNASIAAGKIYTIAARGFVNGPGSQGLVVSLYTDK